MVSISLPLLVCAQGVSGILTCQIGLFELNMITLHQTESCILLKLLHYTGRICNKHRNKSSCVCGASFTTCHVLSCPKGGYLYVQLSKSANKSDGACLDIVVNGFWGGRFEKSYLDIHIFNPHSATNCSTSIGGCYTRHKNEKKKQYEQRICEVECSSFTPIVLSAIGGMARQATMFYKHLASLISIERDNIQSNY